MTRKPKQQGIQGVRRVLGYSKRDLLLFERLLVMDLKRQLTEAPVHSVVAADCEFLADSGFMVDAPGTPSELLVLSPPLIAMGLEEVPQRILQGLQTCSALPSLFNDTPLTHGGELIVAYLAQSIGGIAVAVAESSLASSMTDVLMRFLYGTLDEPGGPEFTHGLVDLVTERLPVPGDEVPLADILDFVSDPETKRKRDRLDIWTRRAAQSGRELQDLSLEMEESLHDFANHMRAADMRSQTSGLRIALSLPLGAIEELLHLRPKGALDVVFEYRDRKASRLEAELAAPGGALAYIYEAEKRFGA